MIHRIELIVDDLDYGAIQDAFGRRQRWRVLPDADEPAANMAGRLCAEICRGWMELHDNRVVDDDDEGEAWMAGGVE